MPWANSIGGQNALAIQEALNDFLTVIYPNADPFFSMQTSAEGVERANYGREWVVKKAFYQGLTGAVEPDTEGVVFGAQTSGVDSSFFFSDQGIAFPNAFTSARPRPYQAIYPLKGMKANMPLFFQDWDLEALPAVLGNQMANLLQGFAGQLASYRVISFYTAATDGRMCGTENTPVQTYSDPQGSFTFSPDNLAINRFMKGQQIDLFTAAGVRVNETASGERIPLIVSSVEAFYNRVRVVYRASGLGASGIFTGHSGPYVVHLRGVKKGADIDLFNGINTFIRNPNWSGDPGTPLLGIDLNEHPIHSSFIYDAQGQPLTETLGSEVLAEWYKARYLYPEMGINLAVTTPGVFNAHMRQRVARETFQRGATPAPREAGKIGSRVTWSVVWNGVEVEIYLSPFVQQGDMYMTKRGIWKRYVPPSSAASGTKGPLGGYDSQTGLGAMEFEFSAPKLMGHNSIFMPMYAGSQPLMAVQAPGRSRMEIFPDQLSMAKIVGLEESGVTASS